MKNVSRPISGVLLAAFIVALAGFSAVAAPRGGAPTPSPSPTGTPAPLPTATPEPPSSAIPRLEAKLKADPTDRDTATELAGYYLEIGRPDLGVAITQKLLAQGSKNATVYYLDGVGNRTLGRIKEATDDLEQASNLEPTNSQVLLTLTDLYLQTNRPADAERVAKRATTFNSTDPRAFVNYGLVLAEEKKYDEARIQFEAAVKLAPTDAAPITLEARSYIDQNAIALAQQTYDRALTVDPKNADAMLGKARLYAFQHQMKDAAAEYDKLLPLLPDDDAKAAMLSEEAKAYATEKDNTDAEALYRKAISQYPKSLVGYLQFGDYYASQNNPGQAESYWTQALGPNRDNREALLRLGELYLHRNDLQRGLAMYERLAELSPNDPSALGLVGQAFSQARQYDKARDAYRRSFELARTPQALAGIGASDYALHNYRECSEVFDAIDKGAGDFLRQSPALYIVMGTCYQQTNQRTKAKDAYTHFLTYVKPGSPAANEIKKKIAELDPKPAPKPSPSPTPKH
jgi:tetratricopeptide (TPR) repeat protein